MTISEPKASTGQRAPEPPYEGPPSSGPFMFLHSDGTHSAGEETGSEGRVLLSPAHNHPLSLPCPCRHQRPPQSYPRGAMHWGSQPCVVIIGPWWQGAVKEGEMNYGWERGFRCGVSWHSKP